MYDRLMLKRILGGCFIAALIGLWLLATMTNPAIVHPLGILLFFVLAYIVTLVIFTAAIIIAFRVLQTANIIHKKQPELQLRRAYMYASVIALAPVILVAMQSVGALGVWDVSLVIIFEILACFYIWRRS